MNEYARQAYLKQGFLERLEERGMDPHVADFCVKQAEYSALGQMSPEDFYEGFAEEVEKRAGRLMVYDDSDGGYDRLGYFSKNPMLGMPVSQHDDAEDEEEEEEEESLLDKIKRWALYTGIGAGGFAVGRAWPGIKQIASDSVSSLKDKYDKGIQAFKDLRKPDYGTTGSGSNSSGS